MRSLCAAGRIAPAAITAMVIGVGQAWAHDAPLPNARQLKQRALASMKRSEQALERYSCLVREQSDELGGDGSVKHHHSLEQEQFFVNGIEIEHTLAKDGKQLTGDEAKKEQQHVDREVKKYSDPAQARKAQQRDEKEVDMFLRALRFSNGHRELRSGRSVVVYELSGDPDFHPRNVEERFAKALTGRIWMDEESGMVVEMRVETRRDVKMGGGLLANVHKGFHVHLVQEREQDGVWILKEVDGSGDLRAALFMHPRFRFRQELDKCHLFSVNTEQRIRAPEKLDHRPNE